VDAEALAGHVPELTIDQPTVPVLRSVLMKPEHATHVDTLHDALLHHLQEVEQPSAAS